MQIQKIKMLVFLMLLSGAGGLMAQTPAPRTVTNADLEKYREARVRSDDEYRQNYKRLGLSSPEELEKREEERQKRLGEFSRQLEEQRRGNESSIRARASALRNEIASVDAQISYLSSQGNSASNRNTFYSFGYAPYAFRSIRPDRSEPVVGPNTQLVRDQAAMFPNAASIRAQSSGNLPITAPRRNNRGGYYASVVIGNSYSQNETTSRLQYLLQVRAGLFAQWQVLEEEARRAGINIY